MHPSELTLSEYVDEVLPDPQRGEIERHLDACLTCRELVGDLREIRRAAQTLSSIAPPAKAWTKIEEQIRADRPASVVDIGAGRRWSAPSPKQLGWIGVAATVVLASAIALRVGFFAPSSDPGVADTSLNSPATPVNGDAAEAVESEMRQAEAHYDNAIKGLQQIANEGESALDPAMAETLQKNLAVIDQAIDESRAAVRSEPTSDPARQSLLENFATKIALLQDTVALINEMRKGNDAGAAQIVSGLK